jgi:isopenicillin N synthase-like dioxygenase
LQLAEQRKVVNRDPYYAEGPGSEIWYEGKAQNLWPDQATRTATERYYLRLEKLAQRLLRLFSLGLTGNVSSFGELTTRHTSQLTCAFHAAHISGGTTEAQHGSDRLLRNGKGLVAGHSDTGLFTIIAYPDIPTAAGPSGSACAGGGPGL